MTDQSVHDSQSPSSPQATSSAQVLGDGLMALFGPAVQAAENGAVALMRSQRELNVQLDAVTLELQRFSAACSAPPLAPYMAKLTDLRTRMMAVNSQLMTLQDRLERLYVVAVPGARIGALGASFNAARSPPPVRQPVLRDEVPLSDPILPVPERVSPLRPPRSPQDSAPSIATNVVPGTPGTAAKRLNADDAATVATSGPSNLSSFVSSAQHYDTAVSSSPLPASLVPHAPPSSFSSLPSPSAEQ